MYICNTGQVMICRERHKVNGYDKPLWPEWDIDI